jgi:cellulose synthase/poly-beta-1,6-N-acetylglucosamine synthase-like glycosyltransferase
MASIVVAAYFTSLAVLACYGLHRWYLLAVWLRHGRARPPRPIREFEELPHLTVQLPIFNERHVVERLIAAVSALDYPRERLDVQVLDDSTDDTSELVAREVARLRAAGLDIAHLRRADRRGYKAGALALGHARARGELIAIFDADFVPAPEFAQRLVHHFTDPRVGMVQARWGHLNPRYSALTRVQSIVLDGHFLIEHTARHRSGRFFNFNGTAGIWRRTCIDDAGGWGTDTLTEDLDLSYRAQLRGWRFVYVGEHVAPAELPIEMSSFKTQQHRWAQGSIQTARKLLPRVWRSALPLATKVEATAHMTAYVGYLPMLVLTAVVVPAAFLRSDLSTSRMLAIDLPLFGGTTLAWSASYALAQRLASGTWKGCLRWVAFLLALGIGLSINNARAVVAGLGRNRSEFRRTPKYNLAPGETLASRRYRGSVGLDTWLELGIAAAFALAIVGAAAAGRWPVVPFFALFLVGYGYTGLVTLLQARVRHGIAGTCSPAASRGEPA